jgi:ubiquinone/menaquinone biosynthesis C-methylase UbiE
MEDRNAALRAFWNQRAGLDQLAGTNDFILKQLEMAILSQYVRDGMKILEVGSGNGLTALAIASRYSVDLTGVDFAEDMVRAAKARVQPKQLKGKVEFLQGDVRSLSGFEPEFDLVITERCLINLASWEEQRKAIAALTGLLRVGGRYLMCEHSQDGLSRLNELRRQCGLEEIAPPWHNRYLRDDEVAGLGLPGVRLAQTRNFSSTYYFLSRIVNAWLSKRAGTAPRYDAEVNYLALELPEIGDAAQGKLWIWERT